eukprot:jgi/Psemu1/55461/gm1.55461_g
MYDYDSNYIDVEPIQSRKSEDILRGFTACYTQMKEDNVHAKIVRMDNETSKKLVTYITKSNLDYQLALPGDHRLNHAERAIQTFKNHFIARLNGVDNNFPHMSYKEVYDYNKHPLAPMGCRVIIHDRAQERGAWQDHGTRGFYIGPALKHYRNYTCIGESSRDTRVSNTVAFFPKADMPETSSTDRLLMILQDIKEVTNKPHPPIPYVEQGTQINEALRNIQAYYG